VIKLTDLKDQTELLKQIKGLNWI